MNIRRVLLVPVQTMHARAIPMGVAYIAAVLEKNGYVVKVYDPFPGEKSDAGMDRFISDFSPDIIGFSTMTPSYAEACRMAGHVKRKFRVPIVFGGVHPTVMPRETLKNDSIDFIAVGEAEYTFLELLGALSDGRSLKNVDGLGYKKRGHVIINKRRKLIENLDELPVPARHLFSGRYFEKRLMLPFWLRSASIFTSRGCPYNCTYCSSKLMFSRRVRFRSVGSVVDEIGHLIKDYKIEYIHFVDDTFAVDEERAIEICREIRRRKLRFFWWVQLRSNTISEKLVMELKKSGCVRVSIGAESGSQRILNVLKKGITPEMTENAFSILRKYRMVTYASFMIGNPTETIADIEMTRRLAHSIKADNIRFFITTPYPGTEMYSDIVKERPEIADTPFEEYHHGGGNATPLIMTGIPPAHLLKIQKQLYDEFMKLSVFELLKNKRFLVDLFIFLFRRPCIVRKAIGNFSESFRAVDFLRSIYNEIN